MSLRDQKLAGNRVVGAFAKIRDPNLSELPGLGGLDFVMADREQAAIELPVPDPGPRAARSVGCPVPARPRRETPGSRRPVRRPASDLPQWMDRSVTVFAAGVDRSRLRACAGRLVQQAEETRMYP